MIETFLTDDIKIYRRVAGAVNDYGEAADTWNLIVTVKGTIQPKTGNVAREEGGVLVTSTHRLYTLAGVNIKAGDKVLDKNSKWYDILYVGDAANRAHHFECALQEIE